MEVTRERFESFFETVGDSVKFIEWVMNNPGMRVRFDRIGDEKLVSHESPMWYDWLLYQAMEYHDPGYPVLPFTAALVDYRGDL